MFCGLGVSGGEGWVECVEGEACLGARKLENVLQRNREKIEVSHGSRWMHGMEVTIRRTRRRRQCSVDRLGKHTNRNCIQCTRIFPRYIEL